MMSKTIDGGLLWGYIYYSDTMSFKETTTNITLLSQGGSYAKEIRRTYQCKKRRDYQCL